VPVFEPRVLSHPQPSAPSLPPGSGSEGGNEENEAASAKAWLIPAARWWIVSGLLGMALLLAVWVRRGGLLSHPPRAMHPLWSQMFSADRPTLLVPGDSGLVMFHGLVQHNTNLDDYLRGGYRTPTAGASGSQQMAALDAASRRYTSIVDLEVAHILTTIALTQHGTLQVRYARDLRPNDLKSGNVILVGASEANPWVELFERNMNFVFEDNFQTHVFSVLNRSPLAKEPLHWDSTLTDPQHRVYGVVAFLPTLTGSGSTLILEGTSMSGTEAAWDFVNDDSQLLPFLNRIRRKDGRIPYFEVVLGTSNISASAARLSIEAWRVNN